MTKRMAISMSAAQYREMVLRIENRGYATVSEYIRDLIRKDEHLDNLTRTGREKEMAAAAAEVVRPIVERSRDHRPGYITRSPEMP